MATEYREPTETYIHFKSKQELSTEDSKILISHYIIDDQEYVQWSNIRAAYRIKNDTE